MTDNPFDQMRTGGDGASEDDRLQAPLSENPFDQMKSGIEPNVSRLGALGIGAAQGAAPAIGGLAGAGTGAEAGAVAGEALFPAGGAIPGAIVGGLLGGYFGGGAAEKTQDYAIKALPHSWQDPITEHQRAAEEQHPTASFLGGLVPMALTMSPRLAAAAAPLPDATTMQRLLAHPMTSRLFGGAVQGAMELGQEKVEGQDANWAHVATAFGFGLLFNKTNPFGEAIEHSGASAARSIGLDARPAWAAREARLKPQPEGAPAAPETVGENPPKLSETVRVYHGGYGDTVDYSPWVASTPEYARDYGQGGRNVFAADIPVDRLPEHAKEQYELNGIAPTNFQVPADLAHLFKKIESPAREPTLNDAQDLKVAGPGITEDVFQGSQRQDEAAEQVAQEQKRTETLLTEPPEDHQPDVTNVVARMEPELIQEHDALIEQRNSLADLVAREGPQSPAAAHLDEVNKALEETAPQVAAAYQRAADAVNGERIEPEDRGVGAPSTEPLEAPTPAAVPASEGQRAAQAGDVTAPEQRQWIADDLERRLIAAGRPADEAHAHAETVAAGYEQWSRRTGGALGSPADLYLREHPDIIGSDGREVPPGAPPGGKARSGPEVVSSPEPAPPLPHEPIKAVDEALKRSAAPDPDPQAVVDQQIAAEVERRPPAKPQKKPKVIQTKNGGEAREIGVNAEGNPVFEDERGVRSVVHPEGIRETEKVFVSPTGAIARAGERRPEFEPVEKPRAPTTAEIINAKADAIVRAEWLKARTPEAIAEARRLADRDGITNDIGDALARWHSADEVADMPQIFNSLPDDVTGGMPAHMGDNRKTGALFIEQVGRSLGAPLDRPEDMERWSDQWRARGEPDMLAGAPATPETSTQPQEAANAESANPDRPGGTKPRGTELPPTEGGVPQGEQPEVVPKPKRIRQPRTAPIADGEGRSGEPPVVDDGRTSPDPRPPVPGEGGEATKPPSVSEGTGASGPDTPGPRSDGLKAAREKIAERSRSNYRITDDDQLGEGGPKQKFRDNIEAIRVLKAVEEEQREATPEEKRKLVKYVGWGAFSEKAFATGKHNEFDAERGQLRTMMTDDEWAAARKSTLNAHYTSVDVIRGMWDAMAHLGFQGGAALEPSAGAGHFLGLIPDGVHERTAWTATELDSITGRIAKALYAGAEVNVHGFEALKRPSNYFDLAISNVPFGNYPLSEKPYGSHSIHNFFFIKSLDKVRPGGIVAFITSRYTMDSQESRVRSLLARQGDLVGAIRLPGGKKGAFATNAGTAVTTDIIFLRKRAENEPSNGEEWMNAKPLDTPDGPVDVNEYWHKNPQMMLGEMRKVGGMYQEAFEAIGDAEGLREKIAAAARHLPEGAMTKRGSPPPALPSSDIEGDVKDGGFFIKDNAIYRRMSGVGEPQKLSGEGADKVKRLIGLRDNVNNLLAAQLEGDKARAETLRESLRNGYDAFTKKYGPIGKEVRSTTKRLNKKGEPIVLTKHPNFEYFWDDPDAYKVSAIERYDPETDTAERATIQTQDVISPPRTRTIDGPADALAATLDDLGRVDLQAIGHHLGVETEDEVVNRLGDLIYNNPNGRQWEPVDRYLSGNVVQKLEEAESIAKTDPRYLRNVEALRKVQPEPIPAHEIYAALGAPWVPDDVYLDFLRELGAREPTIKRMPSGQIRIATRAWSGDAVAQWATNRADVQKVVDGAMNDRAVKIYDPDPDGKPVVNQAATEEVRNKIAALKEKFAGDPEAGIDSWVLGDPDRADRLAAIYNRTYNNLVARKFDGSHLTFPGMSAELSLRQHQKDAIWRTMQNGNTLLAHVVGAGKTFTMVGSGMEMKRVGLIQKPAYVVPNHMLNQFSTEFLQAYPNARILVAKKEEMASANRKAFIAKAAANDWDAVIITHNAFGRIGVSQELRSRFFRDQLDELEQAISAEAAEVGKKAPTVKEMEKAKTKLEERLAKLLNEGAKDKGVSFEETGIDHLFVDEAHLFKNLAFVTRKQRVKGLAQGNSQRAEDLFMKLRYLEERRPGRSAVFATGTPVSNTMAEIWTMMRYLELDKLRERGLDNFDSWANTFGRTVTNSEMGPDGRTMKDVTSFSRFANIPELISLYSEIADTKTADMLNLPRPEVKTRSGAPGIEIVQANPSPQEEQHIQELVELAASLKGKRPKPGEPNMLSVVTAGRKVATDGRLIDPDKFAFNPKGKIALAVKNIARIYKEGSKSPDAKTQAVFLDLGVPGGKARARPAAEESNLDFPEEVLEGDELSVDPAQYETPKINLYQDIKDRLIAEGVPAHEIAFIHDAPNDDQKAALFGKVRSGEIRVLLGSTGKMGVGTNVQKRLIAMHHLDAPWKPAEVEQRDGRIVRQGNLNKDVQIYRYVTKRSFDAFMWQTLDKKAKFIAQVLSGAKGARHAEDIDSPLPEAEEMKAAASGDPRIIEHAELSRQVRQLQSQQRTFNTTVERSKWMLRASRATVSDIEAELPKAHEDSGRVQDISGDKFRATLSGHDYVERKPMGEAIIAALIRLNPEGFWQPKMLSVGKIGGLDMKMEVAFRVSGSASYLEAIPVLEGASQYQSAHGFYIGEGMDPIAIVRRYEILLSSVKQRAAQLDARVATERASVAKLEAATTAKWPRVNELQNTTKKLKDLETALKTPPKAEEAPAAEGEPAQTGQTLSQLRQGKIHIQQGMRSVITLFKAADASTFMHETAHDWLDKLMRYAEHPAATDDLRQDAQTTRKWIGAGETGAITARQHERFARGFEQYLREGVAPSQGLAGVFAKFKSWLMSIYQTAKSLGRPINDDIRGVFDRMLAEHPQRTVIAPERGGPSLATIHQHDAAETPPHQAEAARDRIIAERDQAAAEHPPELAHEIEQAHAEIQVAEQQAAEQAAGEPGAGATPHAGGEGGAGPGGPGQVAEDSGAPEPVAAGGGGGERPGEVERGGAGVGAEGAAGAVANGRPVSGRDAGASVPLPQPRTILSESESELVDKAGNIRIDNLNVNEDVAKAIREAAERNNDFIGDRRGVITDGMRNVLAEALGMDERDISARKLGEAWNAEQIWAARKLLVQSATTVQAIAAKVAEGTDEDLMAYAMARDRHQMIQATVAGITAEAGRALRAFRRMEGQQTAEAIGQTIQGATGQTLYQMKKEAKLVSALDSPEKASKVMNDARRKGTNFSDYVLEWWINGLISGPATHFTYSIGNTALAAWKAGPETAIAAAIGRVQRAAGRPGEVVHGQEVGAQFAAGFRSLPSAVAGAAQAFREGGTLRLSGEQEAHDIAIQQGQTALPGVAATNATWKDAAAQSFGIVQGLRDAFIGGAALLKAGGIEGEPAWGLRSSSQGVIPDVTFRGVGILPIGTAARVPGRFIASIHTFFRVLNYSMERSALAMRQGLEEGLEGNALAERVGDLSQNPSEDMVKQATRTANELTMMSTQGEFTRRMSALTNARWPILNIRILRFIDPFVRISSNVIDQSILQRTPVGMLSQTIRNDVMGKTGISEEDFARGMRNNIAQAKAMSRMIAGSATAMLFGGLAANGWVSGSGPSDPRQAAIWRLAGNQAHSVRIGDMWYDMHRLGPLGMLLSTAADMYDVAHTAESGDMLAAANALWHGITQNILDESFMRGPSDLIKALDDPGRYGSGYIRKWPGSFLPYSVGLAQMARASDPYSRQARTVMDDIKRRVPGLSESLLPRRDIWGEPVPNSGALIAAGVTAIYEQAISQDPVNRAMWNIGVFPGYLDRKIRNVQLTDEQYDAFQRIAGRMAKMRLDAIVGSSQFSSWPAHIQHDVMSETIRQSRETASGVMLMKFPQILRDATQARINRARGQK